jgi:uncharacterized membrane protein
MPKSLHTLLALAFISLPFLFLAFIWDTLPETVPVHFDDNFKADRFAPKSELWVTTGILQGISLMLFVLLSNLKHVDPKHLKGVTNLQVFEHVSLGLTLFMAILNVFIIYTAYNSFQSYLIFMLLGTLFAWLGFMFTRMTPNYFIGIRLPWTLDSDINWRKTHKLGGKIWIIGGLTMALGSLIIQNDAFFPIFMTILAVMIGIPTVYSYRLFKKGNPE